ncbi:MAG TPA: hypothetical protein VGI64_15720 [Streptosporangiaceae bacterium]
MSGDSGLAFWLRYVESRGGLWESAGDSTLVMVPPRLQRRLELPEEFAVTEHPDVAREDGVALLGAGHPLLTAAAEDVLSGDDAGLLTLAAPASLPPDGERLLAKARDQFPVDHGRIDASEPVERRLRQMLRVGALVTYTAAADNQFHERAECWIDVPSRQELPEQAVNRMRQFIADGAATDAQPDLGAIPPALAAAHHLLDQKFSERCQALAGGSARDAAEAELARARKYYAEALASLAKRQANAAPDRRALLAARAESVRAEEKRRLAEIEEKNAARHEIRPYRLHLLAVPVLRLPVDVLRGARRFPLVLDWLLPAGEFAPVRCPACGANTAGSPLVAVKTHLGCANCVAPAAARPAAPSAQGGTTGTPAAGRSEKSRSAVPETARGREKTAAPKRAVPASAVGKAAAAKPRPVPPAAKAKVKPPGPQALEKTGEKLAMEFWSVTGQANLRALRRLCAEDTPAAAAIRLYGISAPAAAVGLGPGERLESLTSVSAMAPGDTVAGTGGYLHTSHDEYTYLLRWHPDTRLICEILPFGNLVSPFGTWMSARLPSPRWLHSSASARMFGGLPEPEADLDPVAIRLWRKALPAHGLPLTLRCLTAWWRISDGSALLAAHPPSVLAAAIHRMVGYRAAEPGVTHEAIADLYRVTAAQTRAITSLLQGRLKLAPQQPW